MEKDIEGLPLEAVFVDSKLSLKSKTFTIRGGGGERLLIWKSSKSRAVGVTTGKHHVQQENEK